MEETNLPNSFFTDQEQMDEVNRQIKMGWERGNQLGIVQGIGVCIVFSLIIFVMFLLK